MLLEFPANSNMIDAWEHKEEAGFEDSEFPAIFYAGLSSSSFFLRRGFVLKLFVGTSSNRRQTPPRVENIGAHLY